MRTLIAAMGLAAFAALPAIAQTGVARGAAPVTPSPTGTGTTTTTPMLPSTSIEAEPVQSSSGMLVGNASPGPAGLPGTATVVPEGNVSVIGAGPTGARVVGNPSAQVQPGSALAASNTPLFDQAAREGRAREQRRRAEGNEPRIYGIAPNTERDLTWQMPDDPIIRY